MLLLRAHCWSKLTIAAALLGFVMFGCEKPPLPPCPAGATLMGAPPPKGEEVWCQEMVNGKAIKNGIFTVYNDSGGKMIEGNYRDGAQDGTWKMWYQNGQRSAIDHYQNGLQDGPHISWYANGQKALEGNYRAGKREGVWTQWNPSGLIKKEIRYKNDKVVG